MLIFNFKYRIWSVLAMALTFMTLNGCGLAQRVGDSTESIAQSIFYKQIKTLHLDFNTREGANVDVYDMKALSVPVMVHIYQLSDKKIFSTITYQDLLDNGHSLLGDELLSEREIVIKPGSGASLKMPMEKEAKFVAVVGLFRQPNEKEGSWRLIIEREDLDPDKPRVINLSDNALALQELKE